MPQPNQDPIQQQLTALRRTQILDAATQVFAEKGFSRATIRDVATAAGVADGTIYNYFQNKTALLLGLLNRLNETDQRREHFAQSAEMELAEFVHGYIKHRFETLTASGLDVFQVVLSETLINHELRDRYYGEVVEPTLTLAEQYFRQWAEQGAIAPLDPQLTPRALAGMVLGVVMLRLMGDRYLETHWQDVPDVISALLLHGLTPDKGA
jgi:AcrR family transcriptional regulator